MNLKSIITSIALVTAGAGIAAADGTPQNHHCKLTDGSFDGGKTNKQCTTAKGTWEKDAELTGAVKTGVKAMGGETTGITLTSADAKTVELDLHGDKALVAAIAGFDGKSAVVTGYLTTKKGVEKQERSIFVVSTMKAAPAPKKDAAPPAAGSGSGSAKK